MDTAYGVWLLYRSDNLSQKKFNVSDLDGKTAHLSALSISVQL